MQFGTFGYYNDVFIDSDVLDKKLTALIRLVSQDYSGAYGRKRIKIEP